MNRQASLLIVAALVLVTALATTAASAKKSHKPVMPKLGLYFGQVVGPPEEGSVEVRETELKVVKIGKRRGAQLRVSPFPATCTGDFKGGPFGTGVLEKHPVPIKNGKFKLDRTSHGPVAGGLGTGTTRTIATGIFKSATKVVVKVYVHGIFNVHPPEQPEQSGTCTGKQTTTAKHR